MIERVQELRWQVQHMMQPVAQRRRRAKGHLQVLRIGHLDKHKKEELYEIELPYTAFALYF